MTGLRILFGGLVVLLGLYDAMVGTLGLVTFHNMGTAAFPLFFVTSVVLMLPTGMFAVICGVGLLLQQPWARSVWLVTSAFVGVFHSIWLVIDLRSQPFSFALAPAVVILLFCIVSWLFLRSAAGRHAYARSREVI